MIQKMNVPGQNDMFPPNLMRFDFPDNGVMIIVPNEQEYENKNFVIKDLRWLDGMDNLGDFNLRRLVINFGLVDIDGNPVERRFNNKFELQIYYTQRDLDFASKHRNQIKVAYWDRGIWIPFELEFVEINKTFWAEFGQGYIGYARVFLDQWGGDPPVALGN